MCFLIRRVSLDPLVASLVDFFRESKGCQATSSPESLFFPSFSFHSSPALRNARRESLGTKLQSHPLLFPLLDPLQPSPQCSMVKGYPTPPRHMILCYSESEALSWFLFNIGWNFLKAFVLVLKIRRLIHPKISTNVRIFYGFKNTEHTR